MSLRGFDTFGIGARSATGREHLITSGTTNNGNSNGINSANTANALSSLVAGGPSALTRSSDALGGVSKLSLTALFSVPLPFRDASEQLTGIRCIAFVTAGGMGSPAFWSRFCANKAAGVSYKNAFSSLFGPAPRVAVGGGLSIGFSQMARMELTYSIPLVRVESDVTRPFQIGFGLSIS